ncbi:MAG: AbrB/MazE/SpoVT family DNA-binding domain-containing protein [Desulfurispora sp.]|uniref:AbrB/MazE/SpoVT family DNA-binding domain-containing protein n=1 Tax=Desulfurispora sp. TaxID=3014275 RepID=UPI00404A79B3
MPEVIQQVQKRMLISLAQIAKKMNIQEGDYVMIEERDGGIFIRPVSWHNKSQEYFWSNEWQEKMMRSARALQNGRFKTFTSTGELLKELGEEDADDHLN